MCVYTRVQGCLIECGLPWKFGNVLVYQARMRSQISRMCMSISGFSHIDLVIFSSFLANIRDFSLSFREISRAFWAIEIPVAKERKIFSLSLQSQCI